MGQVVQLVVTTSYNLNNQSFPGVAGALGSGRLQRGDEWSGGGVHQWALEWHQNAPAVTQREDTKASAMYLHT